MTARVKHNTFRDEALHGWILKTAHAAKRTRKVASWHTLDDLVQEGYLCYWRCVLGSKEPAVDGKNAAQRSFMGYFMRAFNNRLSDLGKKHRDTPEMAASNMGVDDTDRLDDWQRTAGVASEAPLMASLTNPPAEIKAALEALTGGLADQKYFHTKVVKKVLPSGSIRLRLVKRRVRETTDQHYTRCLGKRGLPELVKGYLVDA